MPPRAEIDLYDRFLNLSREAFAAGNFSAAFHGLAAALHCAETLRDVDRLQIIAEEAERQLGVIDAEHPHHRIGSAAAARRGGIPACTARFSHSCAPRPRSRARRRRTRPTTSHRAVTPTASARP